MIILGKTENEWSKQGMKKRRSVLYIISVSQITIRNRTTKKGNKK